MARGRGVDDGVDARRAARPPRAAVVRLDRVRPVARVLDLALARIKHDARVTRSHKRHLDGVRVEALALQRVDVARRAADGHALQDVVALSERPARAGRRLEGRFFARLQRLELEHAPVDVHGVFPIIDEARFHNLVALLLAEEEVVHIFLPELHRFNMAEGADRTMVVVGVLREAARPIGPDAIVVS